MGQAEPRVPAAPGAFLRLLLFGLAYSLTTAWSLLDLVRRFSHYAEGAEPGSIAMLGLRGLLSAACVVALGIGLWRHRGLRADGEDLRALACSLVLALVTASLAELGLGAGSSHWFTRSIFFDTLLAGFLLSGLCLLRRIDRPPARLAQWRYGLEVACVNLLVLLVVLESATEVWSRAAPNPLLFDGRVDERLASMRRAPGEIFFDAQRNSGGYTDGEFIAAGPQDLVVAVIADSFGVGTVPLRFNFVSIAEERLRERVGTRFDRVAVHNFGVGGVGLPEYARLLVTEVESTNPGLVVVCAFIGNDVHEGYTFAAPERRRYTLQRWRVGSVARRLFELMAMTRGEREQLANAGGGGVHAGAVPDFVENSSLEPPTFTPERFLEIERSRLEVARVDDPRMDRQYQRFFHGLRYFHDQLGDRLMVMLLPDEFQVNDAVYERVLESIPDPSHYERDLPQRRIMAFCDELGIACLDLLPVLRRAETQGRTYHLRDTHWNARGNRVAGEALAEALLDAL